MDEKQRLNALEVALNNEKNEREFYLNHAGRTTNPVGKAMFNQIADDELEHYQRLKELHAKWEKNEKWPETVPLTVKQTNVKTIFESVIKQSREVPETDRDDLAAIEVATRFEAKGAQLYADMSDASSDPREKAFFKLLAGIEREHFLSLKDTEEFLKDPAAWFTRKEHHGLDGA
ncbi:MAG: ferritin family protein [Spirochaetes bacterium]|jgi:rubrerythrin|nr:ferritin family protein [Spirochaetota bacterium]